MSERGLSCWSCELPFQKKIVLRDSILRGRSARNGGPYRLYRCPQCAKEGKVEFTGRQRMYVSPEQEYGALDYLFGWTEWLSPTDFLRVARWQRRSLDHRRAFFEHDGDHRYSTGRIRRWIQKLFGRAAPEPSRSTSDRAKARRSGTQSEPRVEPHRNRTKTDPQTKTNSEPRQRPPIPEVPHPYLILGLTTDATDADIRKAFRRLARKHHPDKQGTRDERSLARAQRRFEELLAAYQELMNRDAPDIEPSS